MGSVDPIALLELLFAAGMFLLGLLTFIQKMIDRSTRKQKRNNRLYFC